MRDGVDDTAYRMDALSSNSMKSTNPHSGFHRIEVAPTLDTSDCNPLKNQGGGNDRMRTEIDNAVLRGWLPSLVLAYDGWNQAAAEETFQTLRAVASDGEANDAVVKVCVIW